MALTPMMWDHVQDVFKEMQERATTETVEFEDPEGDPHENEKTVYTGHLTSLFAELGKPAPYYTDVMRALKAMGCVEQLRRGGGSAESKWEMIQPPTEEGFMAYLDNKSDRNKKPTKTDVLEQQLRTLSARVQNIEDYLAQGPDLAKKGS